MSDPNKSMEAEKTVEIIVTTEMPKDLEALKEPALVDGK
jgi:hypothetical protein